MTLPTQSNTPKGETHRGKLPAGMTAVALVESRVVEIGIGPRRRIGAEERGQRTALSFVAIAGRPRRPAVGVVVAGIRTSARERELARSAKTLGRASAGTCRLNLRDVRLRHDPGGDPGACDDAVSERRVGRMRTLDSRVVDLDEERLVGVHAEGRDARHPVRTAVQRVATGGAAWIAHLIEAFEFTAWPSRAAEHSIGNVEFW